MRRQSVAIGAGDRTRPFRLQRPYSAGNARPNPLPGDRRTALHDHAGALRLLLVRAAGTRQIGASAAARGARIRNACRAAERDLGVAGARTRRVRARRASGTSGAQPLVSGTIAQGDPSDPDFSDSVLRHRRQPAMARLFRNDATRRQHALRAADADRMGALRPRALQPACAGRRSARRPRRHPARRRHRPDLHRAIVAQSAAIADGRRERTGLAARIPADQPLRRQADPTARAHTHRGFRPAPQHRPGG